MLHDRVSVRACVCACVRGAKERPSPPPFLRPYTTPSLPTSLHPSTPLLLSLSSHRLSLPACLPLSLLPSLLPFSCQDGVRMGDGGPGVGKAGRWVQGGERSGRGPCADHVMRLRVGKVPPLKVQRPRPRSRRPPPPRPAAAAAEKEECGESEGTATRASGGAGDAQAEARRRRRRRRGRADGRRHALAAKE